MTPPPESDARRTAIVVMAKRTAPGHVKTRLIGRLSPAQAARVHGAMLRCVLERVAGVFASERRYSLTLSLDDPIGGAAVTGLEPPDATRATSRWHVTGQCRGDLGARLGRVWADVGGGPIVFLGVDSPDVPLAALHAVRAGLSSADVVVGPVEDGGYWTLAARALDRRLLDRIDWGTGNVYHQTRAAAGRARLTLIEAPRWFDVDDTGDLDTLRQRLATTGEPVLIRLRAELDRILEGPTG